MFKKIDAEKFYRLIGFGPCIIVTTQHKDAVNAAPIAWHMPVNDEPPIVAIAVAEGHYTAELIKKSKRFVINVVGEKMLPGLLYCGSVSGKKEKYKVEKAGFTLEPGKTLPVPHLRDAIAFIEAKLIKTVNMRGDKVFFGSVTAVWVDNKYFDGVVLKPAARIVHHMGSAVFGIIAKHIKGKR